MQSVFLPVQSSGPCGANIRSRGSVGSLQESFHPMRRSVIWGCVLVIGKKVLTRRARGVADPQTTIDYHQIITEEDGKVGESSTVAHL
ncbi:kinesin family member 24 [Anopheles sinensis]|uniref:Kinesin family member 24 n=1 Tax=Anopheles sinensis TaxID=74873 RepID=A0A084VX16_ANOSI|nr:kinesin family member 24 [Anopheles sinensis]